jgi:two-component system, NarL family, response regulator LiaR
MSETIRVLIVDDHTVVRHGLHLMLEQKPEIEVVGEGVDGLDAIYFAEKLKPDVILMDLAMPRMSGLEAIDQIHQKMPDIRILVLTSFADDEHLVTAVKSGAAGYLLKDSSPGDLVAAIHQVSQGNFSFSADFTRRLVMELHAPVKNATPSINLSSRELNVLRLAAAGLTNPEIATRLFITEGTDRFHFSNILRKLNLETRTQAVLFALRQGLADLT